MIGRLSGRIVVDDGDSAVIDVGGVGYEVLVPLGTLGRAAASPDALTTLFIHTHAREDALLLYGFASEADRAAFRTLIGVSNVGPRTALVLLSALPAESLSRTIAAKDVAGLTRIPGVGKKTAERLVLELKDKLSVSGISASNAYKQGVSSATGSDVLAGALVRMGFKQIEVDRAITAMGERAKAPLGEAVREALALLAK